jgi:hypothetical protein
MWCYTPEMKISLFSNYNSRLYHSEESAVLHTVAGPYQAVRCETESGYHVYHFLTYIYL